MKLPGGMPGGVPGNQSGSSTTVCHMLAKRGSKAGGESRSDRLLGPEGGGGAHRESSSSVGGGRLEREGVVGAFHKSTRRSLLKVCESITKVSNESPGVTAAENIELQAAA